MDNKLKFPVADKDLKRISAGFNQQRGDHIHGAWDLACDIGTRIVAPEEGNLYGWFNVRAKEGDTWGVDSPKWRNGAWFPFTNYFYDMFGGCLVLVTDDGRMYLFSHIYNRQLFEKGVLKKSKWTYCEETKQTRWPKFAYHNFEHPHRVQAGDFIGQSGNSGYSTGPHIHLEVHPTLSYSKHKDRIDPAEYWPEYL